MKKRLIMSFFILLIGLTVVSAACSDSSQTIMKLYSSSNSHAALWNDSVYTYDICYDTIFSSAYGGGNPHDCDGSNRILSLYSPDNSHVSNVSDSVYTYDVCYGDLICEYEDSVGSDCANGGEIVARMYSMYNSHVANASDGDYNVKVCCGTSVPVASWRDMDGNAITNANIGDSVQMRLTNAGPGTFGIWENDLISDDFIRDIVGVSLGANIGATWTISQDDLAITQGDFDEFYFSVNGEDSGYLDISSSGNDEPMRIDILSPVCGSRYDEGVTLDIDIVASDVDDLISGTVSVSGTGYASPEVLGSFSNGGSSFTKSFTSGGDFQIIVDAINSRGKATRVISNIIVLGMTNGVYDDGQYVAACINQTNVNGNIVYFDASTTLGVEVVGGAVNELISGQYPFSWHWRFMPENIIREMLNTTDPLAYMFTANFPVAGDNSAILRVELD